MPSTRPLQCFRVQLPPHQPQRPHRRPLRQSVAARAAARAASLESLLDAPAGVELPRVVPLAQQCRELRGKLRGELLAGGFVWLASGDLVTRNADVHHPYRPASDFFYLAGVAEPGWGCLLDLETGAFTLVAPRVPEDLAIWSGPRPSLDDVASQVGADAAIYSEDVKGLLEAKASASNGGGGSSSSGLMVHTLEEMAPALAAAGVDGEGSVRLTTDFLPAALARSRGRKTVAEIACLLEANRVSAAAHEAIWRSCRPGCYEYQLEAAFVSSCMGAGLRQLGYPAIVGSGRNAGVLHYDRNSSVVGRDDLVLVDAGAEFRCYTADITRTFPAAGAFTAQSRAVYDLTLAMQTAALARVQAGADWKADVDAPARRLMLEGLSGMGLVRGDIEAMLTARVDRIFCPHGLGHHLGLDVHDTSDTGAVPATLEAGHVVTVEPGVYFMPLLVQRALANPEQRDFLNAKELEGWMGLGGVRIEDNVALMPAGVKGGGEGAGGVLNLTAAAGAAPKAADAIEAVMAAGAAAGAARQR